jgi:adhesin transport system membrane fusion protein
VTRTDVRSPVRGTVKQLLVNTIGGVIRPGQDLVEIVPIEDTLLIEARIKPADVAFLRPGLDATVKVTAYDYSIYGGLPATLEDISADTIADDTPGKGAEKFYRIRLRTKRNYLGTEEHPLPIISGMTVQTDILTGKKTVLDYILKPILKARQRAMRER